MPVSTRLSDVIVYPQLLAQYSQNVSEEKSNLIQSGAIVLDSRLSNFLAGHGNTVSFPTWRDLDPDIEPNISNDDPTQFSVPSATSAFDETQVRLERNKSWSSMDMTDLLAGDDALGSIANRIGTYMARRDQRLFMATMKGLFANNDSETDPNIKGDLTLDITGPDFVEGVTNINGDTFIDAVAEMGDSQDSTNIILMHSRVFNNLRKQDLIEYLAPSSGNPYAVPEIAAQPYYLGKRVVVDDMMPASNGIFETWIVGSGVVRMGVNNPQVPVAVERIESAGMGGGQEIIYRRWSRVMHPIGYGWVGYAQGGGPTDAQIAQATSWKRVWPERKQIPIVRLRHREHKAV